MSQSENIDQSEVEKFSSRADQWWEPRGEFKTLHDINPTRLMFVKKNVSLNNARVLDIGCGGGIFTEALSREKTVITGIDVSTENIRIASEHASDNKLDISYIINTAESFAETHPNNFDLITCMELLEHVPDPSSIIQATSKMIKPGGHVIFSTLNRSIKSYVHAVLGAEYLLNLLPKGTHQYKKFIRPSELVSWCEDSDLKINDIAGMQYNPISGRCTLTKQPDVNYLIDTIAEDKQ